MLNKELCKKCVEENVDRSNDSWDGGDDLRWKTEGVVYCPKRTANGAVRRGPDVGCFYFLEQKLYSENAKNAK